MFLGLASLAAASVIGATPSAPAGETCDGRGTRALVVNFVNAFNRGDTKRLDSLFARGQWWKWFSVGTAPGKRIQGAAYNRGTLLKYFVARHRRHERLQLRMFRSAARGSLGIGTVVALLLPYVIWMTVLWTIMFVAWYLLGLPWGF